MRRQSGEGIVYSAIDVKKWAEETPEVDAVRPGCCSRCGAASRPSGGPLALHGHGARAAGARSGRAASRGADQDDSGSAVPLSSLRRADDGTAARPCRPPPLLGVGHWIGALSVRYSAILGGRNTAPGLRLAGQLSARAVDDAGALGDVGRAAQAVHQGATLSTHVHRSGPGRADRRDAVRLGIRRVVARSASVRRRCACCVMTTLPPAAA